MKLKTRYELYGSCLDNVKDVHKLIPKMIMRLRFLELQSVRNNENVKSHIRYNNSDYNISREEVESLYVKETNLMKMIEPVTDLLEMEKKNEHYEFLMDMNPMHKNIELIQDSEVQEPPKKRRSISLEDDTDKDSKTTSNKNNDESVDIMYSRFKSAVAAIANLSRQVFFFLHIHHQVKEEPLSFLV